MRVKTSARARTAVRANAGPHRRSARPACICGRQLVGFAPFALAETIFALTGPLESGMSSELMTRPLQLDHVQLAAPADCESAARAFFGDLLGMEEVPKQGRTVNSGGVWFRTGSLGLHVGISQNFKPAKKAHIALRAASASDLRVLAKALDAKKYPVNWDQRLPGVLRFFTEDPWGNRIELLAASNEGDAVQGE